MPKLVLLGLSILLQSFYVLFAQTTVVRGKIDDPNLKEIRLAIFEDYFSLKTNILAKSKINQLSFKLEFTLNKPYVARLYGGLYDKQILIEPGASYDIVMINDSTQRLKITQTGGTPGLNNLYVDLLFLFDDFIHKNDRAIMFGKYAKETLQFTQGIKDSLAVQMAHPLIADLINYRSAELEIASRGKSRSKGFVEYLYNSPVNIYQGEYMYFFKDFYSNYFYEIYIKNSAEDIRKNIREQAGYKNIAKAFDTIPYYAGNEELRDLALLYGFTEALYDKENFKAEQIWSIIEEISTSNASTQVKTAASNFLLKNAPIKKGSSVVDIEMYDEKNSVKNLHSFIGKPVYLCFFDPMAETSAIEISALSYLYEKYRDSIHFVAIAVKANAFELQEFKLGNAIKIPLYRTEVVEDLIPFKIRSTIAFFTLDAQGKFVNGNGPLPLFADSELEALAK